MVKLDAGVDVNLSHVLAGNTIQVDAGDSVNLSNVLESTSSDVIINAATGSITMVDDGELSASSSVKFVAGVDINLAQIVASSNIHIVADADNNSTGAINNILLEDESGNKAINLTSSTVSLLAGSGIGGIGAIDATIETKTTNLTAKNNHLNGMFIEQHGNLDLFGLGLLNNATVAGDIGLIVNSGTLSLDTTIAAKGYIDIDVTGTITQSVNITAGANIDMTSSGGSITMKNGITSNSDSGSISYEASDDILLSLLQAIDEVVVTSNSGAILDNLGTPKSDDESPNIIASFARLSAVNGIGEEPDSNFQTDEDGLNTKVEFLEAVNSTKNGIFVEEKDGLTVDGDGVRSLGVGRVIITAASGDLAFSSSGKSGSGPIEFVKGSHLYPWEVPYIPSFENLLGRSGNTDISNNGVNENIESGTAVSEVSLTQVINNTTPLNSSLFGAGSGNLMSGLFNIEANRENTNTAADNRTTTTDYNRPKSISNMLGLISNNPASNGISSLFNNLNSQTSSVTDNSRNVQPSFVPQVNRVEPLIPNLGTTNNISTG